MLIIHKESQDNPDIYYNYGLELEIRNYYPDKRDNKYEELAFEDIAIEEELEDIDLDLENIELIYKLMGGRTIYISNRLFAIGLIDEELHIACMKGDKDKVIKLLDEGANINNESFFYNMSPLACACMYQENLEIVKILIERGANINTIFNNGNTAFNFAVNTNSIEMVKLLIQNGANINACNKILKITPLMRTLNKEMIKLLLDQQEININIINTFNEETALHFACEHGLIDNIKYLLYKGIDLNIRNANNKTALECIYNEGDEQILTSIGLDIVNNIFKDCQRLRKYGTKLHLACRLYGEYEDEILLLIKNNKIDINARDDLGRTALYYACLYASTEIIYILIKHNASINIIDNYGRTAYYYLQFINIEDAKKKSKIFEIIKFIQDPDFYIYPIKTDKFLQAKIKNILINLF